MKKRKRPAPVPVDLGKRDRVMLLLSAGLCTQGEAAILAGATRQLVHQWVRKAQCHPTTARKRHLATLMQNAHT